MKIRSTFSLIAALAAICVFSAIDRASANVVTVGQLGTINVSQGTQTGVITIPVFDASGPTVQMSAWQLALRVVPLGGATGTVTIDTTSQTYQPGNIIADPFPTAAPYNVHNTPTAGDEVFGANSNSFSSYTVNGSGQNMMGLKFTASAGATGNFDVRLVEVNENSYWTDGAFANKAFYVNGTPLTLQTTGALSLGTINVSAAAVPEPSSLLLSGTVVGFAAWRARRKKRKAAAAGESASTPEVAPSA